MIADFIAWLVAVFIINPVQAEVNQTLERVGAPQQVIADMRACAAVAPAALLDKATGDLWWTATTVTLVGTGMKAPDTVLVEVVPSCAPAVAAARPFLERAG
jgi:hypothetical protein